MRSPTVRRYGSAMRTNRVIAIASLVGLSGAIHLSLAEAANVVRFRTCAELNRRYPGGIGRAGAVDAVAAGGRRSTAFHVSTALYGASRALDTDHDGIACERVVPIRSIPSKTGTGASTPSMSASVGAGAAFPTGPRATTGPTTEPTIRPNNEPRTSARQASTTYPPTPRSAIPTRSSTNPPPSGDLRVVSATLPTGPPPPPPPAAEPTATAVCNPRFAIACTKA